MLLFNGTKLGAQIEAGWIHDELMVTFIPGSGFGANMLEDNGEQLVRVDRLGDMVNHA